MYNIRKDVVTFLTQLEKNNSYSNIAVNSFLKNSEYSSSDKAFASRLIYGVTERKITLDHYIEKQTGKKINKLDCFVLNCLRLAIYQICFMDKIPDSAAVNESVKIIKTSKYRYAQGFVNGVLRAFLREKPALPADNSLHSLSVRYSCNPNYIAELIDYIGLEDTVSFLQNSLNAPPVYIRLNSASFSEEELKNSLSSDGVECVSTPIFGAYSINLSSSPEKLTAFKKGMFYVQDLASQIAVKALNPTVGDSVLDICAAPGGKSILASVLSDAKAQITACDIYESRLKLIEENAQRLNFNNINTILNDASVFNEKFNLYDKIICDVPCSGYGVIRRKPEIRYKKPRDLTNLSSLQYNILACSARYLKNGGRIMYSTCTLRREENEDIVNLFLVNNPSFKLVNTEVFGTSADMHRLLPQLNSSDGFFFAILEKESKGAED